MTTDSRVIAILGMHRSGTSALTGSLEQAGLHLGETNHQADDNIRGNRELTEIMALHDDLLQRNNGAWDKPVRNMKWDPVHRALQTAIIRTFKDKPLWGFKDPRTLFTANMWLKAIPTLELVGIYRHPFLVADSLMRRNKKTADEALDLWHTYNMNLKYWARTESLFPIIEFSSDPEYFNQQLNALITILKLDNKSVDFFEANLRKQNIPDLTPDIADPKLAHRCIGLYESLKDLGEQSMKQYSLSSSAT